MTSLVLNDIGPEVDPAGAQRILRLIAERKSPKDWTEASMYLRELYLAALPDLPAHRWHALARRVFREDGYGRVLLDCDPMVIDVTRQRPASSADLWPLWSAINSCPVLTIHGALSDVQLRQENIDGGEGERLIEHRSLRDTRENQSAPRVRRLNGWPPLEPELQRTNLIAIDEGARLGSEVHRIPRFRFVQGGRHPSEVWALLHAGHLLVHTNVKRPSMLVQTSPARLALVKSQVGRAPENASNHFAQ